MNAPKFSPANLLTLIALMGSFAVFLMRYSERISKIENVNEEQQHMLERHQTFILEMYPKLEKVNNNVDWLVKQEQQKEAAKP